MGFEVAADAYFRFMGRYAEPLAPLFAEYAGVVPETRIIDVGCGPGALTAQLVRITGAANVAAIDPSPPFVAAAARRCPGVDAQPGVAEEIPYPDAAFDLALAQLVVHFMKAPVKGLREMARVTRPGGTVAACVWDHTGDRGPLSLFWTAVRSVDPDAKDESNLPGARENHLAALFGEAGFEDIEAGELTVSVPYQSFEEWWEPYTLGVGPAGDHVLGLDDAGRERVIAASRARLPEPPFEIAATAWTVRAVRP